MTRSDAAQHPEIMSREMPLDPHLRLWLPLYQCDGDVFNSKDSYGHVVTNYGATSVGQEGMYFVTDDYLSVAAASALNLTDEMTVAFTIFRHATVEADKVFISKAINKWEIDSWSTDIVLIMATGVVRAVVIPFAKVPTSQWNHVLFTHKSGTTDKSFGYVNGKDETTETNVATVPGNIATALQISGNSGWAPGFLNCRIRDVWLYDYAFNAKEAADHFVAWGGIGG